MALTDSAYLDNLVIIVLASHEKALGTICLTANISYVCERVVENSPKFGCKLISEDHHGADSQSSGVNRQ